MANGEPRASRRKAWDKPEPEPAAGPLSEPFKGEARGFPGRSPGMKSKRLSSRISDAGRQATSEGHSTAACGSIRATAIPPRTTSHKPL